MKRNIMLSCYDNKSVEIEADVANGIGIHRPVYFEIDDHEKLILDCLGRPVFEIGNRYWRLTHVNSGLSVLHARTKKAALHARKVLRTIDLDYVASLAYGERGKVLPDDHELRRLINNGDMWLPPGWIWE